MSEKPVEGWVEGNPGLYRRYFGEKDRAVLTQYGPDYPNHEGQWHYIVYREKAELSGIVKTLDEAKAVADELIDMHLLIFIRKQADKIIAEIRVRHEELIEIGCGGDIQGFSDGFRTGYNQALTEIVLAARKKLSDGDAPAELVVEGIVS